jgi:phospholipid/cholesterol/gamma-HCH transport system substrate-binding protein
MENRANYAIVGLFTLAIIAGLFGFVFWFTRAAENGQRQAINVVFVGSVSGLSRGSVVRFNGLRVGEVTDIRILPNDPSRVSARIEIDPTTPVQTDTRARLEYQGLTGVASVQLAGGSGRAPALSSPDQASPPTMFADRSDYQDILETMQRLSGRVDSVLTRAESILEQSEGSIVATVKNAEAFSRAIADNSSGVAAFLANIGEMGSQIGAVSQRIERFVDQAEAVVKSLDTAQINRAVTNTANFTESLNANRANLASLLTDAALLAKNLNASAGKLDGALEEVSRLARAIDADKINRTLDGAERFAGALGRNAGTIDETIRDISGIVDKVAQAAGRLDNVMQGAERFLGNGAEGQTAGVLAEITEAARSIRTLAGNLDKRTGELTSGLNRFTGPGLRELEALTAEARKAVNDLSRATRNLERNPSQLLFGGQSPIPDYRR